MGLWDWLLGRITPDKFAAMMIDAMRQAGLEDSIEYNEDSFSLRVGESRRINLANAYREYREAPSNVRHQVVEHYAFGVFVSPRELTPDDFSDAAPNLRPVVRGRMYPEYVRMQAEIDDDPWVETPSRVIGEHFVEMLAWDMPNRIVYLPESRLDAWGVSVEEAFDVAHENIRAIGGAFEGTTGHIYVGAWDDSYAASRIVTPQMIRKLQVQGKPVVALPNAEFLIVAGTDDDEALLHMGKMISEAEREPKFESGLVLSLEDEGWRPFLPSEDSDAYELLYRHRVASMWRDYDEQQRLLEEVYAKRGLDIHVATFAAHEDRLTHRLSTVTIWTEGLVALLPRAQNVAFMGGDPDDPTMLGAASWQRVVDVAGDRIRETDLWPERWRVESFPTQQQLDAMELEESAAG
ncbi:MAG: hypothetical protein R6V07_18665 [Armatimonadota bacterium]